MIQKELCRSKVLNSVINQIYYKAFDRKFDFQIPIKLVDDPEVAHYIFKNNQSFLKNYDFLESLGRGRFSSNGEEWLSRKELTQPVYVNATKILNQDDIYFIYKNIFKEKVSLDDANFYESLIDAAVETISISFELKIKIPWPHILINNIRDLLTTHQAISWSEIFDQEAYQANLKLLNQDFQSIKKLWLANSDLSIFLRKMANNASTIKNFDASDELIQNLLASSETVASSILWILENACRFSHLFKNNSLPDNEVDIDNFVMECLRLYPPVPFVTRVAIEDHMFGDIMFKRNEPILISIVGIHTHPDYWEEPSLFNPKRSEFINDNYTKLAYIPFLSGARTCVGMKIANMEIRSALKAFFEVFKINQCNEKREFDYGISSKPSIQIEKFFTRI
jgi:hypothetical protein